MGNWVDYLKTLGVILGAISSIVKTYKEVIKPFLNRRRKKKLIPKRIKRTK
jgi:hypothetical protein